MVFGGSKKDTPTHLHLDHEQECMDDDDIIGAYTVSNANCNTTISQTMGQLVEKRQMIDSK